MVAQGAGQKHMEIPALVVGSMSSVRETDFLGMSTLWFVCVCVCVCFLFSKASFSWIIQFSSSLKPSLPSQKFSFFS